MPAPAATLLNWTLGPYQIAREIGRGQFGTVYEATDGQGRPIALKLVPVHGPDSDDKVSAERQGADLQRRFSAAAGGLVPTVLDHQRIDPYYVIAMELVTGQPLTAVIKAGRVADARAAGIAGAICRFLIAAHEFTAEIDDRSRTILVHGDLKPAHVLLLADESIRVLDFGIAKALAARNAATTNLWSSVDYASPERLESGRVNEHADLWALGVILFEMVTGMRPYSQYEHNRSRLETAIRVQEPRLRVPPEVDPRLAAVIDKVLAPQIENRYQSARQIAGDLQAFLEGTPVVAFIEASRANQATVRVLAAARADQADCQRPTEPLPPRPEPVSTVRSPEDDRPITTAGAVIPVMTPPARPAAVFPASTRVAHKPWIAALLSFLAPGLGQFYNRDYLRGIFWLVITPGFWVGSGGLLGWPFHLIAAYTAYRRAQPAPAAGVTSPIRGGLIRTWQARVWN